MEELLVSYSSSGPVKRPVKDHAIFSQESELTRQEPISVSVLGAKMTYLAGTEPFEFPIYPSSDYLLVARLSGRSEVRFEIGRGVRRCDFRYGQLLIYSSPQRTCWRLERPEHTVILSIPAQMLRRAWEQDRKESWPGIAELGSFKQDPQVVQILVILAGELNRSKQMNVPYAESLLFQLATHLVRRYSKVVDSVVRHSGMSPSRLNKVLEYVSSSLEENLRLAAMAQVAGISPFYFCREFKKTMGISPYGYIVQQRIDRAKTLLKNPSVSVTEVATQLLFATPSHFTATFRKLVGCTPSEFRLRS
jgi:AraC family transcriptional regulator